MAIIHLHVIEFRDIPNGNIYLGGGSFKRTANGYESYLDLRGTNVRFPLEIHQKGIMYEATYPDGSTGFVDCKFDYDFDFDEDSTTW